MIVTGEREKTETEPYWSFTYGAFDTNFGPTQWGGPFGRKPKFYYSPLFTTETQVVDTANKMLTNAIALKAGLDFDFIPNPLIEAGDVVEVIFGDGRTVEHHLIDSLTIGLGADESMAVQKTSVESEDDEE